MADVSCPACKGNQLEKYGKTKAGLQKYRCLNPRCRRQFVAGSAHRIDPEIKTMVEGLLRGGTHPRVIAQAVPNISLRWIYDLRKRIHE